MTEAGRIGIREKVICDHSTIGLIITTDGSICDIDREAYIEPERRVVSELKSIGNRLSYFSTVLSRIPNVQ